MKLQPTLQGLFLVACYATLHPALSVCLSVHLSVRPSIRPFVPLHPILRALSPLEPILTQIMPNSPNPSNNTCTTFRRKMLEDSQPSKYHPSTLKFALEVAIQYQFQLVSYSNHNSLHEWGISAMMLKFQCQNNADFSHFEIN